MGRINIRKFALAFGVTAALLYLGCVVAMAGADRQTAVFFFNNLMHGVDVSPILRARMPLWEAGIGLAEVFILGWLTGATVAAIYNVSSRSEAQELCKVRS